MTSFLLGKYCSLYTNHINEHSATAVISHRTHTRTARPAGYRYHNFSLSQEQTAPKRAESTAWTFCIMTSFQLLTWPSGPLPVTLAESKRPEYSGFSLKLSSFPMCQQNPSSRTELELESVMRFSMTANWELFMADDNAESVEK